MIVRLHAAQELGRTSKPGSKVLTPTTIIACTGPEVPDELTTVSAIVPIAAPAQGNVGVAAEGPACGGSGDGNHSLSRGSSSKPFGGDRVRNDESECLN